MAGSTHLPPTMLAYRYKPGESQVVTQRVNVPAPTPEQVLIKVLAAGVCHTDLGLFNSSADAQKRLNPESKSFTLGHEGSGIIVSLGAAVESTYPDLSVGTYVAIYAADACFRPDCYNCSHGMTNICTGRGYGVNLDGAWAAYIAVRAACVVPVSSTPEQIPPCVVSTATDAVLTPYHAMKTCCNLQPEHTVLCLGIGGLGHNAVAIAKKCLGVRCVIACDLRELALENAKDAGADYVVKPHELAATITENRLFIDYAFDFVGSQQTFDLCFASIRGGGTITVVGIDSPSLNVPPLVAMSKQLTYKATFYGTKKDLVDVLQAIADGVLQPLAETRPMREVLQVMADLHSGKLSRRVALVPDVE